MKICFVGDANSAHIIKWCSWFNMRGHDISVISFIGSEIPNSKVYFVDLNVDKYGKLKYYIAGKKIKKIIQRINPDIISTHYASSYGVAMAFSGTKKYFLSVWGSDVYDYPNSGFVYKLLLKYALRKANYLFSTSKAMAEETAKYTNKKFEITPFGVDVELFNPNKRIRTDKDADFVVGTVKGLSDNYGIRYILEAVRIVKDITNIPIKLRIAGKGIQEEEYKKLAYDIGIADVTTWLGFISQEKAAREWANMDVAIIPSILESFGVAAVEAEACETPVIISDVPGLMEATNPGYSSKVVTKRDSKAIADAIIELYSDSGLRNKMGECGRKYVIKKYELNNCFEYIESLFLKYMDK